MPIENYEFIGSYNNQRVPNIDCERTINLFEYIDAKGKKPTSLLPTSGLVNTGFVFGSSTGGFRAEYVLNGFEYYVIGTDIWRRDINNNLTQLNNSLTQPFTIVGTGYVGIDANNAATGEQILFVNGQIGCIWDTGTNTFTYDVRTVDPAFPIAPLDVCFIDGFLLVANGGSQSAQIPTNTFQLSALNNAYSWGLVTNVFTASSVTSLLTVPTVIPTGTAFQLTVNGGTLPPPLVANTTYYAIFVSPTTIHVASSFTNALSNTFITLTGNGTAVDIITNAGVVIPFAPGQLQQGAINSHPGDIVACRTLHRRVFLFSQNYTEVWENAGIGTNLPLRRNNALLMEYGTPAIGSIVTGFDKMVFLSQDKDGLGAVMEVIGTESIPISNRALDFQLAQYAEIQQINDARGIFIKENGIIFYRLNFTQANHTYVYNVTLSNPQTEEGKLWHEEQVLNGNRHPAQTHGYFNGNNYVGSYNQPILYKLDSAFVTNDGEPIPRIRIGRCYVPSVYSRTRIDRWMLDIVQGLPVEPLYSTDPSPVFLSVSKDGGVTYKYRQTAFMGPIGQRTARTVWRKLGVIPRGQGFIPKVEFFSKVPFIILGAAWFFEILPE